MSGDVMVKQDKEIIIYVDSGETLVHEALQDFPCRVLRKKLPVADFVPAEDVGVERKTSNDFVSSIIDGRLFEQLQQLKENFFRPLLIIEGNDFNGPGIHENALRGAFSSVAMDYTIPIIWSRDEWDTAAYLFTIAKREQVGKRPFEVKPVKRPLDNTRFQEFIVSSLPNVSTLTARRLLKKFKTVEGVFNADEKKLQKVDKIGKKKAKRIRELLEKKY